MLDSKIGRESAKQVQRAASLVRVRLVRAHDMIAYLAILFTAIAALFGAPVFAVLPGAAILFSISLREQRQLSSRFAAIGAGHVLNMAAWQSAGHALMACGMAFGLGLFVRSLSF